MKKNTIKAFTLVEMLIVIVIIGILIAALLPRMQAAQGRARDVARKTALSQVQSAIVTYQGDHGKWPGMGSGAETWIGLDVISDELISAWMTNVPVDPLDGTTLAWLDGSESITAWQYGYIVMQRNGTSNAWFALMAKTEVAGWSNFVICDGEHLTDTDDLKDIQLCSAVEEGSTCWDCTYSAASQLRYVILY